MFTEHDMCDKDTGLGEGDPSTCSQSENSWEGFFKEILSENFSATKFTDYFDNCRHVGTIIDLCFLHGCLILGVCVLQ